MTRPITDSELYAAIDGAFDLWQSRYEGDLPAHTFSAGFEEKIAAIPDQHPAARRRKPIRTAAAAAIIAAALTMTIGADVVPPVRASAAVWWMCSVRYCPSRPIRSTPPTQTTKARPSDRYLDGCLKIW